MSGGCNNSKQRPEYSSVASIMTVAVEAEAILIPATFVFVVAAAAAGFAPMVAAAVAASTTAEAAAVAA